MNLPNTRCKLKIPLANFSIGRPAVLSTEPLFQARSSDLCPWAHKSGVSLSSTSVTHGKNSSVVAASPDPQPRGSDTSACVNLGICQGGKPEDSLLILPLNVQLSPSQTCNFPPAVVICGWHYQMQILYSMLPSLVCNSRDYWVSLPHLGRSMNESQCYLCYQCPRNVGAFRNWWVRIWIQSWFQVSTPQYLCDHSVKLYFIGLYWASTLD